jgi:hypothetical protein
LSLQAYDRNARAQYIGNFLTTITRNIVSCTQTGLFPIAQILPHFADKVSDLAVISTIIDGSSLHKSPPESNKKIAVESKDLGRPSDHRSAEGLIVRPQISEAYVTAFVVSEMWLSNEVG